MPFSCMPPRVGSSLRPLVRVGSGRVAWLYSAFPCFSPSFSSVACRAAISAAAVLVSCRSSLSLPPPNRGRFRFWKTPLLPSSLIPTVVPVSIFAVAPPCFFLCSDCTKTLITVTDLFHLRRLRSRSTLTTLRWFPAPPLSRELWCRKFVLGSLFHDIVS